MLYTKRPAGVLPPPTVSDAEFRRETAACRYILALPLSDAGHDIPEYYPMQRLSRSGHELTTFYPGQQAGSGPAIYLLRRFTDTITPE
jgi:hypothetical protein